MSDTVIRTREVARESPPPYRRGVWGMDFPNDAGEVSFYLSSETEDFGSEIDGPRVTMPETVAVGLAKRLLIRWYGSPAKAAAALEDAGSDIGLPREIIAVLRLAKESA